MSEKIIPKFTALIDFSIYIEWRKVHEDFFRVKKNDDYLWTYFFCQFDEYPCNNNSV